MVKDFRDYLEKAFASSRDAVQTGKRGGRFHFSPASGAKVYEHGITTAGTLAQAHQGGRYFPLHASLATLAGSVTHPDQFHTLPTEAKRHFKKAAGILQGQEKARDISENLGERAAQAYHQARKEKQGHKTASATSLDQIHTDIKTILKDAPGYHNKLTHHMAEGIAHTIKGWAPQHEFLSGHLKDLSQKVPLTSPGRVREYMGHHLGGVLAEQEPRRILSTWLQAQAKRT